MTKVGGKTLEETMSFIGIVDRIEDGMAYIVMEDGMFEISVPVKLLKNTQYKEGDSIKILIENNGIKVPPQQTMGYPLKGIV